MISKGFKIAGKKTFEIDIEAIDNNINNAIVKIDHAAICKADLRYYKGDRDEKILGLKYPMRLIHEATGIILKDSSNTFNVGDRVVLIPNLCLCSECDFKHKENFKLGENFCVKAKFASSNYDGFSCEYLSFPVSNLITFNESIIKPEIAVFSELISVAFASIRRLDDINDKRIGIWGDGILGCIVANVIRAISNSEVFIIGKNKNKLEKFYCDNFYISGEEKIKELKLDIAFECVGGNKSEIAINEAMEALDFGGILNLTGVSELGANINTRRILEKAISITGSTRSNKADFENAIKILEDENFRGNIEKLILSKYKVEDINDYYKIFELEDNNIELGKHIIEFKL